MSTSPTKDPSPTKADKSVFTEKEEKVLKAAWTCLKSPPEIDIEKLKIAGDFNTVKTASNTWGVIKKKLAALAPPDAEGDDEPVTPSKNKATLKKRGKKASGTEGEGAGQEDESPTKKRVKKAATTEGQGDDQETESPTKKRKAPKVVKAGGDGKAVDKAVDKTEEAQDGAEDH